MNSCASLTVVQEAILRPSPVWGWKESYIIRDRWVYLTVALARQRGKMCCTVVMYSGRSPLLAYTNADVHMNRSNSSCFMGYELNGITCAVLQASIGVGHVNGPLTPAAVHTRP